jgi:hypothetical protein
MLIQTQEIQDSAIARSAAAAIGLTVALAIEVGVGIESIVRTARWAHRYAARAIALSDLAADALAEDREASAWLDAEDFGDAEQFDARDAE